MTTEVETYSEEATTSYSTNKPIQIIEKNDKKSENDKNELSNDEALDIQINFLKSSTKNIFYQFIQSEQDNISKSVELRHINKNNNNNIDEGIYLYLQNIYDKYYTNEMEYIIKSINNKISYINEKNKEYIQNQKFVERETNTVSQEKIDYFNEKENLDKELELLQVNANQNIYNDKVPSLNIKLNRKNLNESNLNEIKSDMNDIEIMQKTKKLEDLKTKYNKIFDDISANKKEFPIIKNKNSMVQGENMILNEKLKQKRMIWDQIRRENENIKTVVIKRDYNHLESNNKKNKKKDDKEKEKEKDKEKEKKAQSKNLKVSKIGTFLSGFMGNNKK